MLHRTKTPMVVLVTFPRQEREQSLPEVGQEEEESCQMALESKCRTTKENKSTDLFFYFISKLGRKLHKKENKTQP